MRAQELSNQLAAYLEPEFGLVGDAGKLEAPDNSRLGREAGRNNPPAERNSTANATPPKAQFGTVRPDTTVTLP